MPGTRTSSAYTDQHKPEALLDRRGAHRLFLLFLPGAGTARHQLVEDLAAEVAALAAAA